MGAKARATVRDVEIRWIVGMRRGCGEGSSGGVDGELSPVGTEEEGWPMMAERSERKLWRVEQIIRVVGAAWCWRT